MAGASVPLTLRVSYFVQEMVTSAHIVDSTVLLFGDVSLEQQPERDRDAL